MTYYIHHIPGRLRIKSPLLKGNNGSEASIVELLRGLAGVERVAVNAITGSCLIHYDPSVTCRDDMVMVLSKNGYFDPGRAATNEEYLQNAAAKTISTIFPFLAAAAGEVLVPH